MEKSAQSAQIQPSEILEATDFDKELAPRLKSIAAENPEHIQIICDHLQEHVTVPEYEYKEQHKKNVIAFLLAPEITHEQRFLFHRMVANANNKTAKRLLRDAKLATTILNGM